MADLNVTLARDEVYVWTNGFEHYIAGSAERVRELWQELNGRPYGEDDPWERVPGDSEISIVVDREGHISDHGLPLTLTADEWLRHEGGREGFLCSEDF